MVDYMVNWLVIMTQTFNRLTIRVYAYFTKTLNGSSGSSSFLMKGGEIPYQFQGKTNVKVSDLEEFLILNKDIVLDDLEELRAKASEKKKDAKIQVSILKEEYGNSRAVKGIRGALRHSIMNILHGKGISYCSPTMKEQFKGTGEPTLLENEHLMGKCGESPCAIRRLFGMLGEKSLIKVWSDVLIQTDKSLNKITAQKGLSFVHVSTENRHSARRDGKSLQDFSEQYFSGEFQFYVEFTKELPEWLLGLLVKGIFGITHLGKGENSGYGRLEIKDITFERIFQERKLGTEINGKIAILEVEQIENQNHLLQECLDEWKAYN